MILGLICISVLGALGLLLVAILVAAANNMIKIKRAMREFKRDSKGLPILDNPSPFYGHLQYAIKRNNLEAIDKLHKKYGNSIAWLYRDKVIVFTMDLDLLKKMVLDEPNKHINRCEPDLPFKVVDECAIILAKDEQWRRCRKAVAPALKSRRIRTPNVVSEIEATISKLVAGLESRLANKKEAVIEMVNLMHRYSLDLVYGCFYKQNNLIDFVAREDRRTKMIDANLAAYTNPLLALGIVFPMFKPIITWFAMNVSPFGGWVNETMAFIKEQTKISSEARKRLVELRADKSNDEIIDSDNFKLGDGTTFKRNIMDYITDKFLDGKLRKDEYFNSTYNVFMAADKATTDALATALYYLATNQVEQEKTRKSVLKDGAESEYLGWFINETLRLSPVVPGGAARIAAEDVEVPSGGRIPKGTMIISSLYSIHREPALWGPDVLVFKPERWSSTEHFHPCQYIPFGLGVRNCPGRDYALFVIKRVLCELLTRYKFECKPKELTLSAPFFTFLIDEPHYIKVSRLD